MLRQLLTLSNNTSLPEISAWKVKSFWLQLLLVATILLNYLGIDLTSALQEMGFGSTPEQVVATGQRAIGAFQEVILPVLLGIWMWFERRAPKFRLRILPKLADVFDWVPMIAVVVMAMALTASSAFAESSPCAGTADLLATLSGQYGESVEGTGISSDGALVEIGTNAETGTWSIVVTQGHTSCLRVTGEDWEAVTDAAPKGEPT